jgi:plastocyanin
VSFKETEPAANRYAYQGPQSITGGIVTFNFTNAGKQPHELQLAVVSGAQTQAQVVAAITKIIQGHGAVTPSWLKPAGGVGLTPPGATSTATVSLPPGQYYVVDTQSPGQGGSAPPFLTQGAVAPLQVTGTGSAAPVPAPTAAATVGDRPGDKFNFSVSGLKAGKNTLTFINNSKEDHHVTAIALKPGKTLAEAKKVLASNGPPKGPVPFANQLPAQTPVLGGHTKELSQLTLSPGNYVVLCFLADRNGKGKPHFLRGMLKQVTVR